MHFLLAYVEQSCDADVTYRNPSYLDYAMWTLIVQIALLEIRIQWIWTVILLFSGS